MKPVFIEHLFAFQFRNLSSVTLNPHPELNVFLGQNGHGKTNLLESIALGSGLKTIRSAKNRDLILFGADEGRIRAHICGHDRFNVDVGIFLQGKKVQIDGKPAREAAALNNRTAVITFVPDDLHIVTGGASFRRRLLDQTASGLFPSYTSLYRRFEQALMHRNRLLKNPIFDFFELASFDHVFAAAAASIIKARQEAMVILLPQFQQNIADISSRTIDADLTYEPLGNKSRFDSEEAITNALLGEMKEKTKEECFRKMTLCGPHLDDMDIYLGDHAARPIASRGQARAIVLALKIAQMNCIAHHRQIAPILLFDDVVGELDPHNAQRLFDTIKKLGTQTFITTTHLEALPPHWRHCQMFTIQNGAIV